MIAGRLAKRLSQHENGLGEVGFLDDGLGPHAAEKLVLAHDASCVLNERQQRLEGVGRKRHHVLVVKEQARGDVQGKRPEQINRP